MNLEDKKSLIIKDKRSGLSLENMSKIYGLSRSSIQYKINSYGKQRKKRDPKFKLSKNVRKQMQSVINKNSVDFVKCSSLDITNDLNINASRSTVCQTLRCMQFDYKNLPNKFALTCRMMENRVACAIKFFETGISLNKVIFSDEKLFTLHGTDSFYSWLLKKQSPKRVKQIVRSSGIMVWAMIMPNGLLSYEIMIGKQKSSNYTAII